jgi:hypothetical protein
VPKPSTVQKLNWHALNSKVHETATLRATKFKRMIKRKTISIDDHLNNAQHQLIEKNRMHLDPIIDAVITCGRQNIALRGHGQYVIILF